MKHGRLYTVASDVNDPAMTYTYTLYGFQFQGVEENQLLQLHSCPVVAAGQGRGVIKTLFNELSVISPQSRSSQVSLLWDAFAYTLAILHCKNPKNTYRSEQGCIRKDVLIEDTLFYLNNNYREKITLEQLPKKFCANISHICHEFTKKYRISPTNYVVQRRMTEVKWSLANTELSQAEISWHMGYRNVDHLAKLFLRHVGCSLNDYRR